MYWSILQYDDALFDEDVWLPLLVLRESVIRMVPGRLSHITRDLVRKAFFSAEHDARKKALSAGWHQVHC